MKEWILTHPNPRHFHLATLLARGITARQELSDLTGLSPTMISRITNSPLFLEMVAEARQLRAEAEARASLPLNDRAEEALIRALDETKWIMQYSGSEKRRFQAAKAMLRTLSKWIGTKPQANQPADAILLTAP